MAGASLPADLATFVNVAAAPSSAPDTYAEMIATGTNGGIDVDDEVAVTAWNGVAKGGETRTKNLLSGVSLSFPDTFEFDATEVTVCGAFAAVSGKITAEMVTAFNALLGAADRAHINALFVWATAPVTRESDGGLASIPAANATGVWIDGNITRTRLAQTDDGPEFTLTFTPLNYEVASAA